MPNQTAVPLSTSEQHSASRILGQFSKSQIALAFAIEKSRPKNVSTVDYCQQLRKRIKTVRNIPNEEHRYIDSAEYWKDECSRIYLENRNLEDRVNRLEEELRLNRELALPDSSGNSRTRSSIVRQAVGQLYVLTNDGSRKRQLPHHGEALSEILLNEEWAEVPPTHDNLIRMSRYVYRIGRERNNLKNITHALDLDNIEAAIAQTRKLFLILEDAIVKCCTPLQSMKTNSEDSHTINLLRHLMRQVSLAVQSSISFLNVLCRTIAGREKRNHVVYRIAMFFKKSLRILHNLIRTQAACENKLCSQMSLHIPNNEEKLEYAVNKYLAEALSSIITNIKWEVGNPAHRPLLEGILCPIIKQTGHIVSETIFQEPVWLSKSPGNITERERTPERVNGTANLESRYIIQILYAALGGQEKKHLVDEVLASEAGQRNQRQLKMSKLLTTQTNLIQKMLVESVIGGDEIKSLKFPTPPVEGVEDPVIANINVETYSPEWLIEMVWGIIGWDMDV